MSLTVSERSWHVREGMHYVFHLEPPLEQDAALCACLEAADDRYPRLRELLELEPLTGKTGERFTKANYWLLQSPWAAPDDFRPELPAVSAPSVLARGEVTAAGIAFAQVGFAWPDLVEQLVHEEVHLAWLTNVGLSPYLINEGGATWFEASLTQAERRPRFRLAWEQVIHEGGWTLRHLCRNDGFTAAYRQGRPVYGAGAACVGYLIAQGGLARLKAVVRATEAESTALAAHLEAEYGQTIEQLEQALSGWLRIELDSSEHHPRMFPAEG